MLGAEDLRPAKRLKMIEDDASDDAEESGQAQRLSIPRLKVNQEYAQRFEHNKKREELSKRGSPAATKISLANL